MKKFMRILSVIISAVIMAAVLTGCAGKEKVPDTIPVPEGGWSKKELMSVAMLADCTLSCPPIYGDFKRNTKIWEDMVVEGQGFVSEIILYDDEMLCTITYHCTDKKSEVQDYSPIDNIYIQQSAGMYSHQIILNGVKIGDTKDKFIEAMGEPDRWITRSEYIGVYEFTDGGSMTVKFVMDRLYSVSLDGLTKTKK